MNRAQLADVGDPEIATRISQYELAYRMQTSVPELMDISSESKVVHEAYGTQPGKNSFANNCLLARRLVERGVELPETVFGDSLPIPPHKLVHFALYENNCEALVRFLHDRELDPCGWWLLRAHAYEVCSNTVRETRAHIELECTYAQVHPTTDKADKENLGKIMLASFDIEADSSHGDFPVAIKDYTKPSKKNSAPSRRDCPRTRRTCPNHLMSASGPRSSACD